LQSDFDVDELNVVDMDAKKVLVALSEFNRGEFVKGEQIREKTGLIPTTINDAVRVLEKSLFVTNPDISRESPPYDFFAVEISDFGRQVLEKYG
jgi:hypothetical protein